MTFPHCVQAITVKQSASPRTEGDSQSGPPGTVKAATSSAASYRARASTGGVHHNPQCVHDCSKQGKHMREVLDCSLCEFMRKSAMVSQAEIEHDLRTLSPEECRARGIKHSSEDDTEERYEVSSIEYRGLRLDAVEFLTAALEDIARRRARP